MKYFLVLLIFYNFLFGKAIHPDLEDLTIEEHYGDKIPLSLKFINEDGEKITLQDYFIKDKPVIFSFVYYNCTAICNELLHAMTSAIKEVDLKLGKDYQVITLSIDAREGYQMAKAKKANYMKEYKLKNTSKGWHYLTGENSQIEPLAKSIGFKYHWSEKQQEFLHASAIYILTSKGIISHYYYGHSYNPNDLKLSLIEASLGKIGSTFDKIILLCYNFDPTKGKYTKNALAIMSFTGVMTLIFVIIFLGYFWKKELNKKQNEVKK